MNNQTEVERTTTHPFLMFGYPSRVVIDGHDLTDDDVASVLIGELQGSPTRLQCFALSRINGVVKLYIKTIPRPANCFTCKYCKYPRSADDNGGACKCKLAKYKTIEGYVEGGYTPDWCPRNRCNGGAK